MPATVGNGTAGIPIGAFQVANNLSEVTNTAAARASLGVEKKNYIINGAMMISQENGLNAGTTTAYYSADMFVSSFSNAGSISVAQVASLTTSGSPNTLMATSEIGDSGKVPMGPLSEAVRPGGRKRLSVCMIPD